MSCHRKTNEKLVNIMTMKPLKITVRFVLLAAAGFGGASLQAQSATATLSDVQVGSVYDYTLTLQNTGSVPLQGFWYGWTDSGNNLPSTPTSAANSLGWGNSVFNGTSIQYQGSASDALAPNATGTFTFDSTSTPAEITASPSGESVAYEGTIGFNENEPGISSPVFSPTLAAVPEPSTLSLVGLSLAGLTASGWRKVRDK
jgi:hypothetical protein